MTRFHLSHDFVFISQPGHRVPRLSLINIGLCVPSTCSHTDVERSLHEYVKEFTANTAIRYELRVEERMCQVASRKPLQSNTKLVMYAKCR